LFPVFGAVAFALAPVAAGYATLLLMWVRLAGRNVWHLRGLVLARLLAQSLAAAGMAGALQLVMQAVPPQTQPLGIWLLGMIGFGGLGFVVSAVVLGGVPRQAVFDALGRLRRRQR